MSIYFVNQKHIEPLFSPLNISLSIVYGSKDKHIEWNSLTYVHAKQTSLCYGARFIKIL